MCVRPTYVHGDTDAERRAAHIEECTVLPVFKQKLSDDIQVSNALFFFKSNREIGARAAQTDGHGASRRALACVAPCGGGLGRWAPGAARLWQRCRREEIETACNQQTLGPQADRRTRKPMS